jgi:hypothetical protein
MVPSPWKSDFTQSIIVEKHVRVNQKLGAEIEISNSAPNFRRFGGREICKDKFCAAVGINENVTENRNPNFCDIFRRA